MAKRLNIGLFVDELDNNFTAKACQGAELGAKAIDANLFIFPGKYLDSASAMDEGLNFDYQYNTVFQYASEKNLDVLFVMLGTIGCRADFEMQKQFLTQYSKIPVSLLFTRIAGYPSVTFDNSAGFEKAIRHLIEKHGVRKIGMVSGPRTNVDAMERYDVYLHVLEEAGIPFVEDRVVFGDFEEHSDACVRELMARNPDLEAVVFANDMMTVGGYRVFKEMNLEVGRDILVVSFDNSRRSATMSPPLTTVEANPIELTYRAVLDARDYLRMGKLADTEVATHFVRRSSCGCDAFDYKTMAERLALTDISKSQTVKVTKIYEYLFGDYSDFSELQQIKDDLSVLLELLHESVVKHQIEKNAIDIKIVFRQVIEMPVLQYTNTERFFNVLTSLQNELGKLLETQNEKMLLMMVFSDFYRSLAVRSSHLLLGQQERMDQIAQLINTMTEGMFILDSEDEISYELALAKLTRLGISSAYLYTYQDIITNKRDSLWIPPKKLLLKAFCNQDGAWGMPQEKQRVRTELLLNNDYMPKDHRVTMVISPLFLGTEQYGLLLSEVTYESFSMITPIAYQLSAAMKSLMLIEKQQQIQKKLEQSIEKFKESNDLLNEISRSDELTGLYNRRGFLEYAHAAITSKRNTGRKALVIYADMDNLKMINDIYGHDEGDFALCEIAYILKDAFRNTDIVARFGGDEFVAFAMVDVESYANIMKRRITEITRRHNEALDKPYPMELSLGICEFECNPEVDLYEILDIADEYLYEEKNAKKKKNGSYR